MKITSGTIARTIVLVLALANQALAIMGKGTIDIADDTIYQICALGATVVTAFIAWWKNNSFTQAALEGDAVKAAMKKTDTEVIEEYEDEVSNNEAE